MGSTAGKFHLNQETGTIGRCRATVKPCPLGGEEGTANHYSTVAEAKEAYEKHMEEKLLATHSRDSSLEAYKRAHPEVQALEEEAEHWGARRDALSDDAKALPKGSDEWLAKVREKKEAFYRREVALKRMREKLPQELQRALQAEEEERKAQALAKRDESRARREQEPNYTPYAYHPAIEGARHEKNAAEIISAYCGIPVGQVKNSVKKKVKAGMSLTEAYRATWAAYPRRSDKPLVMLDLEAASVPMGDLGLVDTGPYSHVLEVGYAKVHPDGTTERKSYLCGVPALFHEVAGTGAEHVHNISPEMVEGLKPFDEDREKQEELLADLKGAVLVAHNASYEKNQLSHSVPGFAKALEAKEIEVVDTRLVSQYFVPEASSNSNKDFVEATGSTYESAHRALPDALMSGVALLRAHQEDSSSLEALLQE